MLGSFNILAEDKQSAFPERTGRKRLSAKTGAAKGTPEQLVGDFYHSAMDTVTIEKLGATPIKDEMDQIDKLGDTKQALATVAKLQMWGADPMFNFYAGQDPKNSEVVVPADLSGRPFSPPDRDFYVKDDASSKNIREEYVISMYPRCSSFTASMRPRQIKTRRR